MSNAAEIAQVMECNNKETIIRRNLYLLITAKIATMLGSSVYTFAIGLYVLKTTGSGLGYAVSLLCGTLPRVILNPIAGTVADRINRRRLVINLDVLSGVIMLLMVVTTLIFNLSLPIVYLSTIMLSIVSTFYGVTLTSAIPSIVDEKRFQRASALNQFANSSTNILGPILGGVIYALVPITVFFVVNSVSFFVSALLLFFVRFNYTYTDDARQVTETSEKEDFFRNMRIGFNYVRTNRILSTIVISCALINFLFSAVPVITPFILVEKLHFSSAQFGITESALAVGMVLTSIVLSSMKDMKNIYLVLKSSMLAISVFVFGFSVPLFLEMSKSTNIIYFFILLATIGAIVTLINIPIEVLLMKNTPKEFLGRVSGILNSLATGIYPFGILIYGLLLNLVSVQYIMITSGCLLIIVVLVTVRKKDFEELLPDFKEE